MTGSESEPVVLIGKVGTYQRDGLTALVTQTYPKPLKSYQEQLDKLITRGMTDTDHARLAEQACYCA
ncbi:hypothetical protein SAMN05216264_11868 [Pseudomonas marincola]|nr:hypothetical protein SAMN05216264_11868 [Pseudomonas marincola]